MVYPLTLEEFKKEKETLYKVKVTKKILEKIKNKDPEYECNMFGRAGYPMPEEGDVIVDRRFVNPENEQHVLYGRIFEEDLELFEAEIQLNLDAGGLATEAYKAATLHYFDEEKVYELLKEMEKRAEYSIDYDEIKEIILYRLKETKEYLDR